MPDPLSPLTEFIERGGFDRLCDEFRSDEEPVASDGKEKYDPETDSVVGVQRLATGEYDEFSVSFSERLNRQLGTLVEGVFSEIAATLQVVSTQREKLNRLQRLREDLVQDQAVFCFIAARFSQP